MENEYELDTGLDEGFVVTEASRRFLSETAKWAKFLAIVGFVFLGLFLIFGLFFGSIMGAATSGLEDVGPIGAAGAAGFGLIYVVLSLLYFFPSFFLYRFATRTTAALAASDSEALAHGLGQLKSSFKFIGVLTIIMLAFYALSLIGILF